MRQHNVKYSYFSDDLTEAIADYLKENPLILFGGCGGFLLIVIIIIYKIKTSNDDDDEYEDDDKED